MRPGDLLEQSFFATMLSVAKFSAEKVRKCP